MDEGADVVQVHRLHLGDPPGGVLKGRQTDVKVDLVQVAAVERVQLETRRALKRSATIHTDGRNACSKTGTQSALKH